MNDNSKMSIYLHFPFCIRKCRYCDFLSFPADDISREAYVNRLCEEISFRNKEYLVSKGQSLSDRRIETIFFGGGTPSIMTEKQLYALMSRLHKEYSIAPDAEITLECNPKTADHDKLKAFRAMGINRLSIGLQSMVNRELEILGRIHTAEDFLKTYEEARRAGFDNINIDLMSALPGQTLKDYEDTILKVIALSPEHISAYSLIIEPGTPFWKLYGDESDNAPDRSSDQAEGPALPDEETEREMYHMTKTILKSYGYERYEISNYSRPGYECRHNLTYWRRGNYLGLGLGASGMIDDVRFRNTDDLASYMQDFAYEETQILTEEDIMEETIFLGLRCVSGLSLKEFRERFGKDIMDIYKTGIGKYTEQGYMAIEGDRLFFTDKGTDVSDWLLADILSGA